MIPQLSKLLIVSVDHILPVVLCGGGARPSDGIMMNQNRDLLPDIIQSLLEELQSFGEGLEF
jgi:hypothetical protein